VGTISLERFAKKEDVILPIVNRWGKYKGRVINANVEDGWYKFTLSEDVICERKATLLEVDKAVVGRKTLSGYCYGDEIIPTNFQNLFSRGHGETVRVWFLNADPWTAVKIAQLDDKRFYYVDVAFTYHSRLNRLRKLFETEQTLLDEKGITPEEKYLFLLFSLERNTWRHLQELEALKLSEREKKKRAEEFKLNFVERIEKSVLDAGGRFISATRQANNRYLVTWKAGRQIVKSVVHENLRVEHAGFCLSNEDVKHSLPSLINLSKLYREDGGSLYLTRV
jgi:hypothetical protein